jgi:hypothetical protein
MSSPWNQTATERLAKTRELNTEMIGAERRNKVTSVFKHFAASNLHSWQLNNQRKGEARLIELFVQRIRQRQGTRSGGDGLGETVLIRVITEATGGCRERRTGRARQGNM